jgi:outer membrane protein assembly factor BamB
MNPSAVKSTRPAATLVGATAVVLAVAVLGVPAAAAPSHGGQRFTSAAASADPWPQPGFDAGQTGYNAAEHQLVPGTVKHLVKKWSLSSLAGIAVGGKDVYQPTQGGINAYAMSNGHKRRTYRIGNKFRTPSTPVIDGSTMILQVENNLESIELSSGKTRWTLKTRGNAGGVTHTFSPVIVAGSTLYSIETEYDSVTSTSVFALVAISAATGKLLWAHANLRSPIAVGDGNVFAQGLGTAIGNTSDWSVYALNATTGQTAWAQPFPLATIQNVFDLAVSGDTVFAGGGGSTFGHDVYALSAATGALAWEYTSKNTQGEPNAQDMVTDGKTFAYLNGGGSIVALEAATGKLLWQKASGFVMLGGGGVVYSGKYGYQLSTGKVVRSSGPSIDNDPVLVADGRLIVNVSAEGSSEYTALGR